MADFKVNPVYTETMAKIEEEPASAELFNTKFQNVLNNDSYLKEEIDKNTLLLETAFSAKGTLKDGDLNTKNAAGYYEQSDIALATAERNYPVGKQGILQVYRIYDTLIQQYTTYGNEVGFIPSSYIRVRRVDRTWSYWEEFVMLKDIGKKSDLVTIDKSNLVAAVNECFTNAGNGKRAIAQAVTGMGVETAQDTTFNTIATNISNISKDATARAETILSRHTAYADGKKITGTLITNKAGRVWEQSNITTGKFRKIHNANGIWVAGSGDYKGLYYSTDGKTWEQSNITNINSSSIYNANGIWVAGIENKGIYYSVDGKTWEKSDSVTKSIDYAYNTNGIWIASGYGQYYSMDGKTWEQGNLDKTRFESICTVNKTWITYYDHPMSSSGCTRGLYYSTDGKTWYKSNIPETFINHISNTDGTCLVCCRNGELYCSTDGKAWQQSNVINTKFNTTHNANGIWVAGSDNGLYHSESGRVWEQSNITTNRFKKIHNANGIWVAGTNDGKGLYYSTDGKTWEQSNITSVDSYEIYNANGIWVATASSKGICYSLDGKTWEQSNLAASYAEYLSSANGMWIIRIREGLYYSTDGKTWEQSNLATAALGSIFNANGMWVAENSTGGLCYSVY